MKQQTISLSIKRHTELLIAAAKDANVDEIKRLIPLSDPKTDGSAALQWAAEQGHTECVKLLIPVSDPKDNNSQALRWAAMHGRTDCVQLLIPVSDPKDNNSGALQLASGNGHTACVDLLYPVSDVATALHRMKEHDPTGDYWHDIEQRWEIEQQHARLTHELHRTEPAGSRQLRKM